MSTDRDHPRRAPFVQGLRDGVPIALGYFAVAFSLGIVARTAGVTPLQGFIISLLSHASAGEYAGFNAIAASAPYWEAALAVLIANARYLLMSAALTQRLAPETGLLHRFGIGFTITDEIFAIDLGYPLPLSPWYPYGAFLISALSWASGTFCGIAAGNILPIRAVSALSVALYGMFLAIIMPEARRDRVVLGLVALSFLLSFLAGVLPVVSALSSGTRTILLTLLLAGGAAWLFPREEGHHEG